MIIMLKSLIIMLKRAKEMFENMWNITIIMMKRMIVILKRMMAMFEKRWKIPTILLKRMMETLESRWMEKLEAKGGRSKKQPNDPLTARPQLIAN